MIEFLVAGGHRLEYQRLNADRCDRPWLVFLHEGLGSLSLWRDFPQQLCDAANVRGLVYSRYGYGRSDALPASARPHQRGIDFMQIEAVDTLPEVLSQLGIERPLLFGHSDGASIALIHAAHFPGSVAGAIVMAPHVMVEAISVTSIKQARLSYEQTDLRSRLVRHHDDPDSAFYGWNDVWLNPAFHNWDIRTLLTRIGCPVLAIQGEDDEYGTMAQIEALPLVVSATKLLKLPRCGHSPHRDQPQAVIDAAKRFIAALEN